MMNQLITSETVIAAFVILVNLLWGMALLHSLFRFPLARFKITYFIMGLALLLWADSVNAIFLLAGAGNLGLLDAFSRIVFFSGCIALVGFSSFLIAFARPDHLQKLWFWAVQAVSVGLALLVFTSDFVVSGVLIAEDGAPRPLRGPLAIPYVTWFFFNLIFFGRIYIKSYRNSQHEDVRSQMLWIGISFLIGLAGIILTNLTIPHFTNEHSLSQIGTLWAGLPVLGVYGIILFHKRARSIRKATKEGAVAIQEIIEGKIGEKALKPEGYPGQIVIQSFDPDEDLLGTFDRVMKSGLSIPEQNRLIREYQISKLDGEAMRFKLAHAERLVWDAEEQGFLPPGSRAALDAKPNGLQLLERTEVVEKAGLVRQIASLLTEGALRSPDGSALKFQLNDWEAFGFRKEDMSILLGAGVMIESPAGSGLFEFSEVNSLLLVLDGLGELAFEWEDQSEN